MAFLFNGYQTSDTADEQKQNIFGAGAESQGGNVEGSDKASIPKTTTEGASVSRGTSTTSGSNKSTGSAPSTSVQTSSYNPKAVQSAYNRIGQTLQLPTQSLGKAQSAIQEGQQKLQDEANKYAAAGQSQAEGFKLDDTTIQQAAQGDKDAYAKTAERLNQAAPQTEAFKGLGSEIPDVGYVRDTGSAYRDTAGPNYTAGQSRLDAALLRRNPEYLRIQQQILSDANALGKANQTAIEEKTKAQDEMLKKAYQTSTDDIRGRIGGFAEEVTAAAKKREAEEDKRRGALDPAKIAADEYAKLKEKIRQDLATADPRSQQYRSAQYLDSLNPAELAQYVNVDKDTDWQEFIDQAGADRYNRLQGLLGSNQMLTPSAKGAGADYAFDEGNAYRSILDQITGKRAAQDVADQKERDAIIAQAQKRAGEFSAGNQGDAYDKAEQELRKYIQTQYSGQDIGYANQLATSLIQDMMRNSGSVPNYSKYGGYIKDQGTVDWTQALDPASLNRIQALDKDLGAVGPQYGAYTPEYDLKAITALYDQLFGGEIAKRQTELAARNPSMSSGSQKVSKNRL